MTDPSPNILFILTDQQRRDSMKVYGNNWIKTPNLNSLSDKSLVFENAYVTQPVCTPARASIMTGLYPQTTGLIRNGIPLPDHIKTIGDLIDEKYYNAYMGKWHLGNDVIAQRGFDTWISVEDFHRSNYTKKEYRFVETPYNEYLRSHNIEPPPSNISYEGWVGASNLTEDQTQAGFLGNMASKFIKDFKSGPHSDRPWMLYVSFFEPHPPYTGPLNDLYDPNKIEVGPAFLRRPENGSLVNRLRADYYMGGGLNPLGVSGGDYHDTSTEIGWRKLLSQYYANVTLVDNQLKKIFESLEESNQTENTIIIFTSEHGEMGGDHGMLEKRSLYEEASRVPLIVHIPWLREQQRKIQGSISQVDLVPTLLELTGSMIPSYIEGQSRVTLIDGKNNLGDNDVFLQWNGMGDRNLGTPEINRMVSVPWRTIVGSDRWKLNLSPGDQCELYDLNTDPYELTNLYDDARYKDRIRDMAAKIRIWQDTINDRIPLPSV